MVSDKMDVLFALCMVDNRNKTLRSITQLVASIWIVELLCLFTLSVPFSQ